MKDTRCDIAIVGGGLAGGLIAHALSVKRPELQLRLIDPSPAFGGNHVWSFFDDDIAARDRWIVEPFISQRWRGYDIAFPSHKRMFDSAYNSIRSDDFDAILRARLPKLVPMQGMATLITPTRVDLNDGHVVAAKGVIDARGAADLSLLQCGWQKFVGQEYRTARPHGITRPIIMDATVPQIDGYRFVYVLPFGEDRLFVEDTYYSDTPAIDRRVIAQRLAEYVDSRGWGVAQVLSEEIGVLPVTKSGDFDAYWQSGGAGVAKVGARAGLFHPTTGYSLPDAVRTAALIATLADLSGKSLHDALHTYALAAWHRGRFYRLLDRMLFDAGVPETRLRTFERFYRLRPGLIARFYAGKSSRLDKLRILTGKPPVPIRAALKVLQEKK